MVLQSNDKIVKNIKHNNIIKGAKMPKTVKNKNINLEDMNNQELKNHIKQAKRQLLKNKLKEFFDKILASL